ncbi:MAG: hypothetical protein JW894_04745 [Bacteroidales bacterium]|nr:hypothetical protein [Bacteroidales bacterium]
MLENLLNNKDPIFNDDLPKGHRERFADKLDSRLHSESKNRFADYYTAAASVLVLITTGVIIILLLKINRQDDEVLSDVYPELYETEMYYINEISNKMNTLTKHREIKKSVLKDIKEIDKSFITIKEDLEENPGDERLIDAAINTYQIKLELINMVLSHIK